MENRPPAKSLRGELGDTLKLAAPIVLNQVGHMSMGVVDTLVAGQVGTTALAGLGLASNFFWTFTSICLGVLLALETYFAQSVGARDEAALGRYLGQSVWTCGIVTALAAVGIVVGHGLYVVFAEPGPVPTAFSVYIKVVTWCLPSLFVFFVLQRYWQARHRVLEFSVIIILANVLNLGANLALGLGWWGFPRLEVEGLALATVISRYAMLAAALAFTGFVLRPRRWRLPRIEWPVQREFFRLGLPAAGHTGLEIGAFTLATFIVSTLGAVPLAANHLAMTMASFTFMFPLGFSAAAAIRVGNYVGARQPDRARVAGWLCIGLSVTVMSGFALAYLLAPRQLLGWFTSDPAVIALGVQILMVVAFFQIADGFQVSTTGALRGIGNTHSPMIANLVGHYPVGLVLGLIFCFGFGYGVMGMWLGLAAGLISVAVILARVWTRSSRDPAKLVPLAREAGARI